MTPKKSLIPMYSFLSEPIIALITIPFAFYGPGWYAKGWLTALPLGIILKRRKKKKRDKLEES